ncbi:FG-GAP and VCBS repeat-containing protein [Spirillospora albida]|uniref:FG-GAP and VCBS repeat-containing protein n=1 Tax=Spirillospora albida TaxID=58123 RepID=UPI0014707D21|nr:FG-GAP and VCBS repeat-containing protein [Spirillospora albida]
MRTRPIAIAAAAVTALGTVTAVAAANARPDTVLAGAVAAKTAAPGDFDGDGKRDIASASPNGIVSGQDEAGFVTVVYGTSGNPAKPRRQVITQASPGVPGNPSAQRYFGRAIASADFDRDGRADLAVSDHGTSITIVYGGAAGLTSRTVTFPSPRNLDGLAAGDFNGNGAPDLAVVSEDAVHLYRDLGAKAVTPTRHALPPSTAEFREITTVAADFNGDRRKDLVVLTTEVTDGEPMGSWAQLWHGTTAGFGTGKVFAKGALGGAAAAGDLNGDGKADLVLERYLNDDPVKGSIAIRLGTATGFGAARNITQDTSGVPGAAAKGDRFGAALAIGDLNRDGKADLAVGAPGQTVGKAVEAGRVTVLRGAKGGITTTAAQLFTQATAGIPGAAEKYDNFGAELAFNDFTGDGRTDLVIGTPNENGREGRVYVLRATATGVTVKNLTELAPATLGIAGRNAQLGEHLLP